VSKTISRSAVAVLALTVGLTGIAQAEPLNIWSASRQADISAPSIEQVQYRRHYRHHHDGIGPGAAAAIGIGAFAAGAAIASSNRRYYDDRYYGDGYYEGRSSYVEPRSDYCDTSHQPKHYPAPAGC
jgi:hypothetical protein